MVNISRPWPSGDCRGLSSQSSSWLRGTWRAHGGCCLLNSLFHRSSCVSLLCDTWSCAHSPVNGVFLRVGESSGGSLATGLPSFRGLRLWARARGQRLRGSAQHWVLHTRSSPRHGHKAWTEFPLLFPHRRLSLSTCADWSWDPADVATLSFLPSSRLFSLLINEIQALWSLTWLLQPP